MQDCLCMSTFFPKLKYEKKTKVFLYNLGQAKKHILV